MLAPLAGLANGIAWARQGVPARITGLPGKFTQLPSPVYMCVRINQLASRLFAGQSAGIRILNFPSRRRLSSVNIETTS